MRKKKPKKEQPVWWMGRQPLPKLVYLGLPSTSIQELTHKITVRRPWKESGEECGLVLMNEPLCTFATVQVVWQWGEDPPKVTALHMVTLGISSWQQRSKKSLLKLYLIEQDTEYFVLMFSSTMENNIRERSLWNPGTSVILTTYSSGTSISWLLIWSMMSWGGFPSTVHPTDCKQK